MGGQIVYRSKQMEDALELIERVARSDTEILICGPSGVGKELFAEHAHRNSRRADRAFVSVNCANLAPDMLENEIFGHAKGAFTGAATHAGGIADAADGGTLFLDEVDALPLASQAKILRFAEQKEYRRLGENCVRRADFRLVAACNADLDALMQAGKFRSDLFYRLNVAPVEISPLRERAEDIPVLLDHFVEKYGKESGVEPLVLSGQARKILLAHDWPGNVRELQNCVRFLACQRLNRPIVPADLPANVRRSSEPPNGEQPVPAEPGALMQGSTDANERNGEDTALVELAELPMSEAKSTVVEAFERDYLDRALTKTNGNVAEAARRSGKNRRTIFQLLQKYGLSAGSYRWRE